MRERENKVARRALLAGTGTAGALAAAAALMPGGERQGGTTRDTVSTATEDASGGYRLTEHIRKYYRAARV
ncbi:MAG TPA: formate dehydrogenase [Rubrivivax sp.]|nr:formate dehydrogenase [Pseudomonadota bacterium]HOL37803.1 formate dehydrogenase [Rubrivivax sp.]HPP82134.1 formate dehydrogenase [Rubrivivax sp.]